MTKYAVHLPVIILCVVYVIYSVSITGHFQNHNGDYAQYLIHARNVLLGRPWSYLLDDYAAILPGFPLLLVPVLALYGLQFGAIAGLHGLFVGVMGFVTYYLALQIFTSRVFAFLACALFLSNSYLLSFSQDVQPNIFFAFTVVLAFFALQLRSEGKGSWRSLFLVVAVLLPGIVRLEAVALYIALLFARELPSWRWRLFILCLIPYPILVSKAIRSLSDMRDYGVSAASSKLPLDFAGFMDLAGKALSFLIEAPERLCGLWFGADYSLLLASFVVCGVIGFIPLLLRYTHIALYALLHLGLLFVFTLFDPVLPARYLIPLLWVWAIAACLPFAWIVVRFQLGLKFCLPLACAILIALVPPLSKLFENASLKPAHSNYYTRNDLNQVFSFVTNNFPDRKVAFYKPRIATLLLDERGIEQNAIGVRSANAARALFHQGVVIVIFNAPVYRNGEMLRALLQLCNPAFSDGGHLAFVNRDECSGDRATER